MMWPSTMSHRSPRAKWAIGLGFTLIIYTVVGCCLLPVMIKWQILKRLTATTHRVVSVQQVKLNPFVLSLTIRGLALKETNDAVFFAFDELHANLQLVSIFRRAFVFKEIRIKKPVASVILQPDGKFNFSNLFGGLPPETKPKREPQKLPHFVVARLRIEDGALIFEDLKRKFLLRCSQIGFTAGELSNEKNAPVAATLFMVCNKTGKVALQGTVLPFARSADLGVQVTDLDLGAIQPYLQQIWKLEITDGVLNARGRVQVAAAGRAAPQVQFKGELGIAKFAAAAPDTHEEFLKLDSLTLTGLDLRYLPHGLNVTAVNVAGLRGSLVIHPDKTSNWKDTVKNAEQLHDLIVQLQLNKLFPFQIGTVSLENNSLAFVDRSIEPNVVTGLQDVGGRVTGLSSSAQAIANVNLHGKVDDHSTFTLSGTISPLADDLALDLFLSLKNGEMPPGSPYAAKYGGYPIHQGQLSLEGHYTVTQRVLKAENKFTAHQLRLGAKSNSPDATQLQIKLAIALLQDRDGVLAFDVLVNGNLDDPNFKLGPIVTQVFMNIITKTVSNPFELLGSLFGSSAQLSFVNFEPGRSDFAAGETRKLDTLAKALDARPALELEITGSVDTTHDRIGLAAIKLDQQLQACHSEELAARGNTVVSGNSTTIPPEDYERLIKLIYIDVVGTNPVFIVAPPAPVGPMQNFGVRRLSSGEANLMTWHPLDGTTAFVDLTVADMEAVLIDKIAVTPDDFRVLMKARADKVLNYLRQTGQVPAERMFLIEPKSVDSAYRGHCRVDLSLK